MVEKVRRLVEATVCPEAAPRPVRRLCADSRSNRVERDIAVRLEQVRFANDVRRRESAAEEVSAPFVLPVEPLRVSPAKVLHTGGEVRLLCVNHEVEVGAHQAIGETTP